MSETAIICVDDEIVILESLKEQLKRQFGNQYVYETAESAEEAWELIQELEEEGINVILIISDWLMPGTKGDEFLIKVHENFPGLVTVMLTGQADEGAINRAKQQANLHACIYKPWSETELKNVITSALQ